MKGWSRNFSIGFGFSLMFFDFSIELRPFYWFRSFWLTDGIMLMNLGPVQLFVGWGWSR